MKQKKTKAVVVILALLLSFFGFSGVANSAPCFGEDCFTGDIMRINPSEYLCDVSGSYSITILDEYKWWDDYYEQYVYDVEFCVSPYTTYGAEDLVYAYGEPMWNYGGEPVWWDGNEVGHYAGHFGQGFCGQGFDEDRFSVVTRQLPKTYDIYVEVAVQYSYYPDPFKFFTCYNPVGSITINEDETIDVDEPVFIINGECGAYNGQKMTLQDFDASSNTGKCAKGDYTNFWNDGLFGYWVCKGSDDGSDDVCSVSWEVQNGACGAYNGQKMTLQDFDASSNTGKCAVGEYKNFSSDLLNGYWTCGGVAMGNDVNCGVEWRDEDEVILPDLPDLEDCSSLSIPNKWFCEMRNFFLSAFFPSADKMNDLTETIDRMKNKAPFNYLRLVKDKFDNLNENIQETDQVEISLLGNTGTIDIDQIPLRKIIFDCFSIMVVIGFAFWALKYIKSIF